MVISEQRILGAKLILNKLFLLVFFCLRERPGWQSFLIEAMVRMVAELFLGLADEMVQVAFLISSDGCEAGG